MKIFWRRLGLFQIDNGASEQGDQLFRLCYTSDCFSLHDSGQSMFTVYFDYQKAFDSVPYYTLMEKIMSLDLNVHLVS